MEQCTESRCAHQGTTPHNQRTGRQEGAPEYTAKDPRPKAQGPRPKHSMSLHPIGILFTSHSHPHQPHSHPFQSYSHPLTSYSHPTKYLTSTRAISNSVPAPQPALHSFTVFRPIGARTPDPYAVCRPPRPRFVLLMYLQYTRQIGGWLHKDA